MTEFRRWISTNPRAAILIGLAVVCAAYAWLVIARASPDSFYPLDDPYIHLAVAENLTRGHFGVNAEEAANPSSSILWPWLLAATTLLGAGVWAPLAISIICFLASVAVLLNFLGPRLAPDAGHAGGALALTTLAFLSANLFGVVFTGLEHSFHVLLSLVVVTRAMDGRYDRLMFACLVLSPLVRFEGFAVLALGLGAAVADRRYVFAAGALACTVACVLAWMAGMVAAGLPPLPSSVLVKAGQAVSAAADAGHSDTLSVLAGNLAHNLRHPGSLLMIGLAALACIRRQGRDRIAAIGLAAFLIAALTIGPLGGYPRYEVYVLATAMAGAFYLFREELRRVTRNLALCVAIGLAVVAVNQSFGLFALISTPQAARNIHQQQHQMHRFAAECWRKPVAANDLGWISYRNDAYVLDLWGLGSEEARLARASGERGWMDRLARERGVDAALIYSGWFRDLPEQWIKVGELRIDEASVSPAAPTVDVYATREAAVDGVAACLSWLADEMPAGSRVVLAR